jgi:ABC-2 type transport system ATP-binding protein
VRAVCDRLLILSHGKLVANDTPEALEALFSGSSVLCVTIRADEAAAISLLGKLDGVASISCDPHDGFTDVSLTAEAGADLRERVFFACADARIPILQMTYEAASLEQVFLELTGDASADAAAEEAPTETTEKEA